MASAGLAQEPSPAEEVERPSVCVLSIDNGGPRGLSSLFILEELLQQVNERRQQAGLSTVKPCELFDLIGGTGTGGLIALLLGRLELTVTECIEAYIEICDQIFVKERRSIWFGGKVNGRLDASQAEAWITRRISIQDQETKRSRHRRGGSRTELRSCKVFVCASHDKTDNSVARLRFYHSARQRTTENIDIPRAVRATLSTTTLFDPIMIDGQTCSSLPHWAHNPWEEVMEETQDIWTAGNRILNSHIKCFVSIGAGNPDMCSIEGTVWEFTTKEVTYIASEARKSAEDFYRAHEDMFLTDRAFRFDVSQGLDGIGLEEHKQPHLVSTATINYLRSSETIAGVQRCVTQLAEKDVTSLSRQGRINTSITSVDSAENLTANIVEPTRSLSPSSPHTLLQGHRYPKTSVADSGRLHQGDQYNHFHYSPPASTQVSRDTNVLGLSTDPSSRGENDLNYPASGSRSTSMNRRSRANDSGRKNELEASPKFPVFLMPYGLNPRFVNRQSEASVLSLCFFGSYGLEEGVLSQEREQRLHRRAALYGLGGVGKTQLAISFAHRHRELRPDHSIFWIHASTEEWLRQSFQKLADACGIEVTTEGHADVFTAVGAWLKNETTCPWLMILDNADDANMLFHTRRRLADTIAECPHGALLVTTRNKKVAEKITFYGKTIHVKEMSEQQSVDLMNSFLGDASSNPTSPQRYMSPAIKELVKSLQHLPLAMAQAAAYIKENSITVQEYLTVWKESAENAQELLSSEFEADGRQHFDASVPNAVGTTMMLSLVHLYEQGPRTGKILVTVSFLHPTSIKPFLLLEADEKQSSTTFIEAIGDLHAFSLVSKNAKDDNLEMHRLVHHVVCKWRSMNVVHAMVDYAARFALDRLNKALSPTMKNDDRQKADAYLPHALQFLEEEHKFGSKVEVRSKIKLMQKVAEHLLYQGRVLEARNMRQAVLDLCTASSEVPVTDSLRAKCELAEALEQLHHFSQAKSLCYEIHSSTVSGKPNRTFINSLRMMARISVREKAYERALKEAREAKAASSAYLGPNHEETLVLDFAIAETLEKYAEHRKEKRDELLHQAKSILEQAIDDLTQHKGSDAAQTMLGKQHLTNVLDALDDLEESETLSYEILASKERCFGAGNLETFQATLNLALCFIKQAKLQQAEELLHNALHTASPVVNAHYLGKAKALQMLADIHLKRAHQLRQEWLNLYSKEEQSDTQNEAQPIQEPTQSEHHRPVPKHIPRLQSVPELSLPADTSDELGTSLRDAINENQKRDDVKANLYATTYQDPRPLAIEQPVLIEYQSALKYRMEVVDILLTSPGIEHPNTIRHLLDTSKTMLLLYRSSQQLYDTEGEQAEKWQKEVLEVQTDLLGDKHEDTLDTKALLAATLHERGKSEEAEPYALAAFKARLGKLGKSASDTLVMQQLLAEIMNNQPSSRARSIELMHSCWQLTHQVHGPHHTDTKLRLALWRRWKDSHDQSAKKFETTNSGFVTVPSISASRIIETDDGMTRLLTHNAFQFTMQPSFRIDTLEGLKKRTSSYHFRR